MLYIEMHNYHKIKDVKDVPQGNVSEALIFYAKNKSKIKILCGGLQ